ncbi:MAG: flavodoxin family protein [Patescibacteria group bacterium]
MPVCQKDKKIFYLDEKLCPYCGEKLIEPSLTDNFLKSFLEIDDKILKRFKDIRAKTIIEAKKLNQHPKFIKAIGITGSMRFINDKAKENSSSEFLVSKALAELKTLGVKTELLPLRKFNIQPCRACYSTTNTQCHFYCSCYPKGTKAGDDMSNILYDKVLGADIILFGTPVNNFKISTLMAAFIDRCISLDGSLAPADPKNPKNRELNIKHTKFVELMAEPKIPGSGYLKRFIGKAAGIFVTGHEEGASMLISQLFMTFNNYGMAFPSWSHMYAMSSVLLDTAEDKPIVTSPAYIEEAKQIARNTLTLAKLLRKEKTTAWLYDNSAD